jgi:hypothetical protein
MCSASFIAPKNYFCEGEIRLPVVNRDRRGVQLPRPAISATADSAVEHQLSAGAARRKATSTALSAAENARAPVNGGEA